MPGHGGPGGGTEAPPAGPELSLVVVGSHNFVLDGVVTQFGNLDLFLNTVSFLMKDNESIGIRPRELRQAALQLTNDNLRQVLATLLFVAGLFVLGAVRAGRRKSLVLG
jgi:hypothetical protein